MENENEINFSKKVNAKVKSSNNENNKKIYFFTRLDLIEIEDG
jgi:hypothetical protein